MKTSKIITQFIITSLFILAAAVTPQNSRASAGSNGPQSSPASPPPAIPGGPTTRPDGTVLPQTPDRPQSTITVTNNNDSGAGSLRQAIIAAIAGDTIDFDSSLAGQVIVLTSGQLNIDKNLVIDGSLLAARVSLSGNHALGVFYVYNNAAVTLKSLAVINGYAYNGGGAYVAGGSILNLNGCLFSANVATNFGGGVYNEGALNVATSVFSTNQGGWGGGIENRQTLSVADTTFLSNSATSGGAGAETFGGSVTIVRSSFIDNVASNGSTVGSGGGFQSDPGTGNVNLTNLTFSGNQASGTTDDGGGAIMSYGGTLYLSNLTMVNNHSATHGGGISTNPGYPTGIYFNNTIISGNTAAGGSQDDLYGTFHSQDYNLIGATTGATLLDATAHNRIGANPQLNSLADNGGSGLSFALLPGSPAVDAIPSDANGCGSTLAEDQRGEPRPVNYPDYPGGCDIGAFERQTDETYTAALNDGASQTFGATLTTLHDNAGGNAPGVTTVTRTPIASTSYTGGAMPFYVYITAAVSSGLNVNLSLCYTDWEANHHSITASLLELYHNNGGAWQRSGADSRSTDLATGVTCVTKNNVSDLGQWTLFDPSLPTAVNLVGFSARPAITRVQVAWQTVLEVNTLGFNLYRSASPESTSERQKLNAELIPAHAFGGVGGASYEFIDLQAQPGIQYYYWLEVINLADQQLFGPQSAQALYGVYLPSIYR